jgi:hypothetical protein
MALDLVLEEKRLPGFDQSFWEVGGKMFHNRRDALAYAEQLLRAEADTTGTMTPPNVPPYDDSQMKKLAAEIFGSQEEADSFKELNASIGKLQVSMPAGPNEKNEIITKPTTVMLQQNYDAEKFKAQLLGGFNCSRYIDPLEITTPPDFEMTWMVGQNSQLITTPAEAFRHYQQHASEIGRGLSEEYKKIMANLPIPVVVDKGKVYSVPTKSQATHMATSKNNDNWLVLVKIVQPPPAEKPSESAPPVMVGRTTRKIHL